jgi:isoleucyl-tRNA synthetase
MKQYVIIGTYRESVLAVSVEIVDVISDATVLDFEDFQLSVKIDKI